MKNILVAGGAGFIGSHLCEKLLELDNRVICLDNLSTGSRLNISDLERNPSLLFVKGDTRSVELENMLAVKQVSEIYDLASPASVDYVCQRPIEATTANSLGTYNLLQLAEKHHARFIFASSSEVYGDPSQHPQREDYWGNVNPVGVRSGYDEGKRFGEALCMAYKRERNLEIKIVRIFNTYGPRSSRSDSRVVPSFINKALQNMPLLVHGQGEQTRSFCYVSDLVDGLVKMMDCREAGPVNIGNPDEYKIIDLAEKIIKLTGSVSQIQFTQRPKDDPSRRKPDISLANRLLNWHPKVNLNDGLIKTIDYIRKVLGK